MRWGVRRTPEQLGHAPSGNGKAGAASAGDSSGGSRRGFKKVRKIKNLTEDELNARIKRLRMEEDYENLVKRQKERNTGPIKKIMSEALGSLGNKLKDVAIDKVVSIVKKKINGEDDDDFDIDKWMDKDVAEMDAKTIQDVSKWYNAAQNVTAKRKQVYETDKALRKLIKKDIEEEKAKA